MASPGDDATRRLLHSPPQPGDLADIAHFGCTPSLADSLTFEPRAPSPSQRPAAPAHPGLGISVGEAERNRDKTLPYTTSEEMPGKTLEKTPAMSFAHTPLGDPQACPSQRPIWRSRAHWSSIIILFFSVFSTAFSGIYLGISVARPVWPAIRPHGSLEPGTASVLQVAFAKLIEMTFVTVCVAFIGQNISRRAWTRHHKGVNLAELGIRNWIMQPGSIIAHPKTVRYAIWSALGVLSMIAAVCALLYTTAAEALVSPQLVWDDWKDFTLHGEVSSSFGNRLTVSDMCNSLPVDPDWDNSKNTCLQLLHSGQSYSNFELFKNQYMSGVPSVGLSRRGVDGVGGRIQGRDNTVAAREEERVDNTVAARKEKRDDDNKADNKADDKVARKQGLAKYNGNIQVKASWVEQDPDPEATSKKYGRIINNFTIAAPHPGIVAAAQLALNNIPQPRDKTGVDNFQLNASLPSPAMWVTCASASEEELRPIIWEKRANKILDVAGLGDWDLQIPGATFNLSQPYSKGYPQTALDSVFGWGANSNATGRRYPPFFAKLPKPFNTVLNATRVAWGVDAIYMLANVDVEPAAPLAQPYAVCSMKAGWVPWCSTHYESASGDGGLLEAVCSDADDRFQYHRAQPDVAGWGQGMVASNWIYIASEWAGSLSWNDGITDSNSSSSRLMSQLFPRAPALLPAGNPTLAEAIGVMGLGTLLMSAEHTPFSPLWPWAQAALDPPVLQSTSAALRLYRYASRPSSKSQEAFMIILAYVFLANVGMLVWFIVHRGMVTDYTEPANLFSVAINSPPSADMAGACGGGPLPHQYRVNWFVDVAGEHVFLHSSDPGPRGGHGAAEAPVRTPSLVASPVSLHAERLQKQRWSLL